MNNKWIDFLQTNPAHLTSHVETTDNTIVAITDLAIIEVTGKDATHFLQGQITCDVDELTKTNSFFSAFCNAKGRVISTLLLIKNNECLLLLVPLVLLEKVINTLQMYILRADVQLHNGTHKYGLIGLNSSDSTVVARYPTTNFEVLSPQEIILKLPSNCRRYLLISLIDHAMQLWTQFTQTQDFISVASAQWRYQDISAGLAWLDQETTCEYIPQMLNIDKLGGISFQKGCYTGQEIIARTHYLGKAKRELVLAECDSTALVARDTFIINHDNQQTVGKIIALQKNNKHWRMLIVMSLPVLNNLVLHNTKMDKINIIAFQ